MAFVEKLAPIWNKKVYHESSLNMVSAGALITIRTPLYSNTQLVYDSFWELRVP